MSHSLIGRRREEGPCDDVLLSYGIRRDGLTLYLVCGQRATGVWAQQALPCPAAVYGVLRQDRIHMTCLTD